MVHITSMLCVAALIATSSFAAPVTSEETRFTAREVFDDDVHLASRTLAAGRILGQTAGRAAVGLTAGALGTWSQKQAKSYLNQNSAARVPAGLSDAARKASGPFSQAAVDSATHRGHNRRDLEELESRMLAAAAGRAAVGVASNALGAWGQNKAKGYMSQNSAPRVPAGLSEAAKKASGPFSQAAVNSVTHRGQKKRSFSDFEEREYEGLEEREFMELDELD